MSANSDIEWTDATWNFLLGCSLKSTGCANCYAIRTCWRLQHNPNPKIAKAYEGLVRQTESGQLVWTGRVNMIEERLALPLSWKKPRRIFVNSESDLFHESVPFAFIDRAFAVMALCPRHTFQILTKRPDRMWEYFKSDRRNMMWSAVGDMLPPARFHRGGSVLDPDEESDFWDGEFRPLENVWLGVSVEDQKSADERIPPLIATPALVRFLSCEPLLGPLDIEENLEDMRDGGYVLGSAPIHWVICGGESGPKARPMHPDWARSLRDQCQADGVPFFFKQWGEWFPGYADHPDFFYDDAHGEPDITRRRVAVHAFPPEADGTYQEMGCIGKKASGRLLDGREWNEFPSVATNA